MISILKKERINPLYRREMAQKLKIHAETYRLAEKLGIELLKVLATQNFFYTLNLTIDDLMFAPAIELVYKNSASENCVPRSAVRDLCLFNHTSIMGHEGIIKVMEEHEPDVWRVGCRVAEGYIDHQKQAMHYAVLESMNHSRACQGCGNDFIVEEVNVSQYKAADESYGWS